MDTDGIAKFHMGDVNNFVKFDGQTGIIQQGYTAPTDNNTAAGAGIKIVGGKIEAYGGDQTFGGTMISSDGNYMVTIGKYLTATGLTKRYPLNNATNFTADGQVHIYAWDTVPITDTWVEVVDLGKTSDGSFDWGILVNGDVPGRGIKVEGGVEGIKSVGASGAGITSIVNTVNTIAIVAQNSYGSGVDYAYGLQASSSYGYSIVAECESNTISPLQIDPSGSASVPSHTALKGSFWVDSNGNMFMNVTGGGGVGAWKTIGIYYGNLITSAVANGSMCAFDDGGVYRVYVKIAAAWYQIFSI